MPTSRCVCGPQVPYDYSLGMASRQFNKPRCPCTKCKNRVREAEVAVGKQVTSSGTVGICGQCIKGAQIGNPVMAGPESFCQGCSGVVASTLGQGQRHIQTPGAKTDAAIAMGQPIGCNGKESNCGQSSTVEERNQSPNQGQIIYTKSNPNQISRDYNNSDKGVLNTSGSGGLTFAGPTFGRQSSSCRESSVTDPPIVPWQVEEQPCNVRSLNGLHGDNLLDTNRHMGRDTLGRPIDLLGTGVGSIGMCTHDVVCDENCGYGTGCDKGCRKRPVSLPGGASNRNSDLRGPVGIDIFGNEQVNCFLTFLMEILGILVFFAICTITFWITLGYYIVHLVIDLKNADRYVQIAVAIIFCLLVLAFCITLITNNHGPCCRNKDKGHKVKSKEAVKAIEPKKGSSYNKSRSSKSVKTYCSKKTTCSTAKKAKQTFPNKIKGKSTSTAKPKTINVTLLKKACKRICPKAKKAVSVIPHKAKMRYTDCQGRAIFHNSRRYAIPTEMKQPPAIIIWLRDLMCRLFRRS